MTRPLLLLTNDDGYDAPALAALRAVLERDAQVVVCAPARNQSAVSHALTLDQVLRLRQVAPATFTVDGTPADCIYVAVNAGQQVLPRRPDLVVSGMNRGPNLGVDINYSGTVAAAREAALRGLPAVAISTDLHTPLGPAAELAGRLVQSTLAELEAAPPRQPVLLNINIPQGSSWPIRLTRQGGRPYADEIITRTDPRGQDYLWLGSGDVLPDDRVDSDDDTAAFNAGCVSITPLRVDVTARELEPLVRQVVQRTR